MDCNQNHALSIMSVYPTPPRHNSNTTHEDQMAYERHTSPTLQ